MVKSTPKSSSRIISKWSLRIAAIGVWFFIALIGLLAFYAFCSKWIPTNLLERTTNWL